jgi:hypothetical protein
MNERYYKRGWCHRMKGLPIDYKAYDKWAPSEQRSYEEGRRLAAISQYHKLVAPCPVELYDMPMEAIAWASAERGMKRNPRR